MSSWAAHYRDIHAAGRFFLLLLISIDRCRYLVPLIWRPHLRVAIFLEISSSDAARVTKDEWTKVVGHSVACVVGIGQALDRLMVGGRSVTAQSLCCITKTFFDTRRLVTTVRERVLTKLVDVYPKYYGICFSILWLRKRWCQLERSLWESDISERYMFIHIRWPIKVADCVFWQNQLYGQMKSFRSNRISFSESLTS